MSKNQVCGIVVLTFILLYGLLPVQVFAETPAKSGILDLSQSDVPLSYIEKPRAQQYPTYNYDLEQQKRYNLAADYVKTQQAAQKRKTSTGSEPD